jgi:hypothetical protein
MTSWTIADPGTGGSFVKDEHVGHLLLLVAPRGEETTKFSGEGTQIAARVDFLVCTDCGLVLADQLVFGEALAPRVIDQGEIVAGRLALGKARPGRNAPYVLEAATDSDRTTAQVFLGRHAARLPSGKVVIEQPGDEDAVSDGTRS